MELVFTESARNHGIDPEDAAHAFRNAVNIYTEDDLQMWIGPNRSGTDVLEVGAHEAGGVVVIVHVMKARPKYLR